MKIYQYNCEICGTPCESKSKFARRCKLPECHKKALSIQAKIRYRKPKNKKFPCHKCGKPASVDLKYNRCDRCKELESRTNYDYEAGIYITI